MASTTGPGWNGFSFGSGKLSLSYSLLGLPKQTVTASLFKANGMLGALAARLYCTCWWLLVFRYRGLLLGFAATKRKKFKRFLFLYVVLLFLLTLYLVNLRTNKKILILLRKQEGKVPLLIELPDKP